MPSLVEVLAGCAIAASINVSALAASRRGRERLHNVAFLSGVTGLLAMPLFFVGLNGFALMPTADMLLSSIGLVMIASFSVLASATLLSLSQVIRIRRSRPNNSSKPTPLRGAA